MKFARIENDIVVEILNAFALPDFHPDLIWVENVPDEVQEGWLYDGSSFSDPDTALTADEVRDEKIDSLNALYDEKINGGFTYDGNLYHLDASARTNMGLMKLNIDGGAVSPHGGYWIGKTGRHALNDSEVVALANTALSAYQGLLFARQTHIEALEVLTDKTAITNYDINAGWPSI